MYVDDCDLIQSGQDPLEVAKSMQTVVQQRGDLMEATGGALDLKPSKLNTCGNTGNGSRQMRILATLIL